MVEANHGVCMCMRVHVLCVSAGVDTGGGGRGRVLGHMPLLLAKSSKS